MTPEPPAPTPRRKRRYLRWLGVLLLGYFAYAGWKAYDYNSAVEEAKALGWLADKFSPFDDIKFHWRAALRMETWTPPPRYLGIEKHQGSIGHQSLLLRLNPQHISIYNCRGTLNLSILKHLPDLHKIEIQRCPDMTDADLDQIQELTDLKELYLEECARLTRLNPFIGLKKLEYVLIQRIPTISKKDIQAFRAAHPDARLHITQ